ncbi:MAG: glycosyl-4,4'-diaponeurosporenoate acyltransferase [Lachnospiraceae bacterium]|nr:glycosyl-4,4'-diaponeurosporenoate acyltransferase [Lachnospiraceae bacterium]
MRELLRCIGYLAVTGILSFIIGRLLPKKWFDWEAAFFQCRQSENGGRIYERYHIRKWKDIVPDMNKILPALMPGRAPKALHSSREEVEGLLQETCVAEVIHLALAVAGLWCVHIWPEFPGLVLALLNVVGNLPFIMIQRYNRPRFCKIYRRFAVEEKCGGQVSSYEGETA